MFNLTVPLILSYFQYFVRFVMKTKIELLEVFVVHTLLHLFLSLNVIIDLAGKIQVC